MDKKSQEKVAIDILRQTKGKQKIKINFLNKMILTYKLMTHDFQPYMVQM